MADEKYKKWLVPAIIIAVACVVIVFYISAPQDRKEKTEAERQVQPAFPSGPIMDTGMKEGLRKMPDDPESLAVLGDKFFESNKFDQAIEMYEKVLELAPDDADTYNDLGLAYFYTGKTDLAVEKLKKGTEIMPSLQRVWLSLGYVLLSSGRNDEARPALKKAFELAPGSNVGREAKRMLDTIK